MSKPALRLAALALFMASSPLAMAQDAPPLDIPAGTYVLEKTHASLHWRIKHMGMSNYTARFKRFDVTLQLDPANLARSSVEATVDIASLETDYVAANNTDFNAELKGEPFFNAAKFPQATYKSRSVRQTGPGRLRVEGDLTLLGVTKPVPLDVQINGSLKSHPFAKLPAVGFSVKAVVPRVAFGLNPPPVQQGVATDVDILIEAEFLHKP